MFYVLTYAVMTVGAFAVVGVVAAQGRRRPRAGRLPRARARANPCSPGCSRCSCSRRPACRSRAGSSPSSTVFSAAIDVGQYQLAVDRNARVGDRRVRLPAHRARDVRARRRRGAARGHHGRAGRRTDARRAHDLGGRRALPRDPALAACSTSRSTRPSCSRTSGHGASIGRPRSGAPVRRPSRPSCGGGSAAAARRLPRDRSLRRAHRSRARRPRRSSSRAPEKSKRSRGSGGRGSTITSISGGTKRSSSSKRWLRAWVKLVITTSSGERSARSFIARRDVEHEHPVDRARRARARAGRCRPRRRRPGAGRRDGRWGTPRAARCSRAARA